MGILLRAILRCELSSGSSKAAIRWRSSWRVGFAAEIVALKETDPQLAKTHIKPNPDLPGRHDLRLFLVFDGAAEVDEEDTVFDSMFSAFSNQDLTASGQQTEVKSKAKSKKRRKSSSSGTNESESSDISSSLSSSSDKKKKKKKKDKKDKKSKKENKNKKGKGAKGGLKRTLTAKELERKAQEEKRKEEEKAEKKRERDQLKKDKEAARDKERDRNILIRDGKKAPWQNSLILALVSLTASASCSNAFRVTQNSFYLGRRRTCMRILYIYVYLACMCYLELHACT